MKITASQEDLSHGLRVAGRAVAARSPLPITTNVLLTTEDSRLKIAATNLDIAISTWIDATVAEEGAITLPAKLLSEFVDTLAAGPIDLSVKQGSQSAHVASGRFEANIRGMAADDFPVIPTATEQPAASVQASLLKEMIEQVVFATAADDTRPILTGVLSTFSGSDLTLAAADGFRLAMRRGELAESSSGDFSVIIPSRTLAELARVLPDGEQIVEITVTPNRNQVVFRTTDLHVVSRLIEGAYPNLRQIIPTKFATKVVVSTGELLKATKIASFFSRDNSNAITLEIQPGGEAGVGNIVISGAAAELGEDRGEIDAVVNGSSARVQFNSRYVSDVLGAVQSAQVGLEISGPNSAAVFKPIDSVDYTHVIMPMHTGAR
ncbi:MAG TPA: DNA polymerase III subunit beta [Chloroflexota bacterium]